MTNKTKTGAHLAAMLLEADSLGTLGTEIFLNHEPADVHNTITLYDYDAQGSTMLNCRSDELVFVQARVKCDFYGQALETCRDVIDCLAATNGDVVDGCTVQAWHISGPVHLMRTAKGETIFVASFKLRVVYA